jgi:hypothetical protein
MNWVQTGQNDNGRKATDHGPKTNVMRTADCAPDGSGGKLPMERGYSLLILAIALYGNL